jgi:hypothetical protein
MILVQQAAVAPLITNGFVMDSARLAAGKSCHLGLNGRGSKQAF